MKMTKKNKVFKMLASVSLIVFIFTLFTFFREFVSINKNMFLIISGSLVAMFLILNMLSTKKIKKSVKRKFK